MAPLRWGGRGVGMVGLALVLALAAREPGAGQARMRVGVVLSLSGPFAAEGTRTLAAIEDELRRGHIERVVLDDRGTVDGASVAVQRLLLEERVAAVIGPVSAATTTAVASAAEKRGVAIVSLAVMPREARLRLAQSNPAVVAFSSVSPAQLDALGRFGKELWGARLGLVSSSQAAGAYTDEIVGAVGAALPRQEAPIRAPLSRIEDVAAFGEEARRSRIDVVLGAVAEPVAGELVKRLRDMRPRPRVIVFSPPDLPQRGRVAARLVLTAIRDAGTPERVRASIQRSALYHRESHAVVLNWSVTELGTKFSRFPLKGPGGTHSCTCASRDGAVLRQCDCFDDQKCEVVEEQDTCRVRCK